MSYSAEKIEGSDDLLTKILLLLPARPLFRFKLVSKRWMSHISDPRFSSLWKPESFPSALILQSPFLDYPCYCIPDKTESKVSTRFFDFIKDDFVILNCCGGLIVCRKRRVINEYIVCNPTTKQFHTLPNPNVESLNMSLAFDHSISPHYKVINVGLHLLIHKGSLSHSLPIKIYSSDTNSWRRSRAKFPETLLSYVGHREGIFFDGAIFWIFREVNSFCYFDIDTKIIHSYQLPKMGEQYYCGCVHGNLHLVGSSLTDSNHINVFVLGNDYSSWSLKYCIDQREPTSCVIREMICRSLGLISLEFTFTVLTLMTTSEGNNQLPYLVLYMPRKFEFTPKNRTCERLPLPSVHHLFDNPFWIGSKLHCVT